MPSHIAEAAHRLSDAAARAEPCAGLGDLIDRNDPIAGYAVQAALNDATVARGWRPLGHKVGLTSSAVQAMFGASEPMRGLLFVETRVAHGGFVDLSTLCAPRLEGEIVLKVGMIPDPAMDDAALAATIVTAHAAFEIADSRCAGWQVGIGEAIADNACCGRVGWLDEGVALSEIDLAGVRMTIESSDRATLAEGSGAACLGSPLASYRWLVTALADAKLRLAAGDIILTGALAPSLAMSSAMTYGISLSGLGTISLRT